MRDREYDDNKTHILQAVSLVSARISREGGEKEREGNDSQKTINTGGSKRDSQDRFHRNHTWEWPNNNKYRITPYK